VTFSDDDVTLPTMSPTESENLQDLEEAPHNSSDYRPTFVTPLAISTGTFVISQPYANTDSSSTAYRHSRNTPDGCSDYTPDFSSDRSNKGTDSIKKTFTAMVSLDSETVDKSVKFKDDESLYKPDSSHASYRKTPVQAYPCLDELHSSRVWSVGSMDLPKESPVTSLRPTPSMAEPHLSTSITRINLGNQNTIRNVTKLPDWNPPREFLCPLSHKMMKNPVVAPDGHTYEKKVILKWLESSPVSPLTNQPMGNIVLKPDTILRAQIVEWKRSHQI